MTRKEAIDRIKKLLQDIFDEDDAVYEWAADKIYVEVVAIAKDDERESWEYLLFRPDDLHS